MGMPARGPADARQVGDRARNAIRSPTKKPARRPGWSFAVERIVAASQAMIGRMIMGGDDMANKNLTDYMQERLAGARRNLSLAAIDFSIPDEKILELRESVRREAADVQRLKKKKGFLGFLGI
jgi:hypothetical protein